MASHILTKCLANVLCSVPSSHGFTLNLTILIFLLIFWLSFLLEVSFQKLFLSLNLEKEDSTCEFSCFKTSILLF